MTENKSEYKLKDFLFFFPVYEKLYSRVLVEFITLGES